MRVNTPSKAFKRRRTTKKRRKSLLFRIRKENSETLSCHPSGKSSCRTTNITLFFTSHHIPYNPGWRHFNRRRDCKSLSVNLKILELYILLMIHNIPLLSLEAFLLSISLTILGDVTSRTVSMIHDITESSVSRNTKVNSIGPIGLQFWKLEFDLNKIWTIFNGIDFVSVLDNTSREIIDQCLTNIRYFELKGIELLILFYSKSTSRKLTRMIMLKLF